MEASTVSQTSASRNVAGPAVAFRRAAWAGLAIRILVVADAVTFLVASLVHFGLQIPLGFAVLADAPILDAGFVEGAAGLLFCGAAAAVFARAPRAWDAAVAAHAFGIAGVTLGIVALAAGLGPTTLGNYVYHRVILAVLLGGLALLMMPSGKAAMGRRGAHPGGRA